MTGPAPPPQIACAGADHREREIVEIDILADPGLSQLDLAILDDGQSED